MIVDYDAGRFWLDILVAAGNVVAIGGVFILAKMKANAGRIDKTEERMRSIETEMSSLPDKAAFRKLESDVALLAREMSSTSASLSKIGHSVTRMEDFLMSQGARK
ncbi:MAG: hypothetical protein KDH19_01335 [Geminicoccaceae bacterium]|nr:hypothetical protein [Geminicoccaceae bacterium]